MSNKVNNFLRDDIDSLKEYKIVDSKGMIKLDAMENPFDLDVNFKITGLSSGSSNLNRYPDANCESLRKKLRAKYKIGNDHNIIFGNGSDELIQLICLAFLKPENTVLVPSPSFSMYEKISRVLGLKFKNVPLKNDFSLDINLMLKKIAESNPAIIFLAYPNNPTGNLWSKKDILEIINKSNGVVVIDEAYGAFSGQSFVTEINKYENLVIMKTLSKIGFAGIRLGYLFGENSLINNINKLRLPFNINSVSQKISDLSFENNEYIDEQIKDLIKLKGKLTNQMKDIGKVKVYESKTNFVLFKILDKPANDVFNHLISCNILIKNISSSPGLENCLRVTVGSEEENNLFIQSLKKSLI